jgi:hypothetical protein
MKTTFITFILFSSICIFAQKYSVQGIVMDNSMKKPLQNVQVILAAQNIGTITDKNGLFTIPSENLSDSVIITHIGYKPNVVAIKNLQNNNRIYLQQDTLVLPNYSTSELTPATIVRLAYHSISQNYDSTVCRYEATLNYQKYKEGKVFFDGDFTFDILTRYGYPDLMQDTFNLRAVLIGGTERINRKHYNNNNKTIKLRDMLDSIRSSNSLYLDVHFLLSGLIENNHPKRTPSFLQPNEQKHYRYAFAKTATSHYYIVSFSPRILVGRKYHQQGEIIINKEDFSILEFSYKELFKIYLNGIPVGTFGYYKHEVSYKKENGKYYLQKSHQTADGQEATVKSLYGHLSILTLKIQAIDTQNTKIIDTQFCIDRKDNLEELSSKYKELFQQ